MIVQKFQDLEVYRLSFQLQQKIFRISKPFPKEEAYSLTDQIRRSSRSVGANISEAWRKRRYPAHFASKLSDSDGENAETQHWLATALDCGYLDQESYATLIRESEMIGAMLGKMIDNAENWKPRDS
jgi:four helix bundle protein